MSEAVDLKKLLSRLTESSKLSSSLEEVRYGLSLSWPGLEALLPGGCLPRGVVELSAPFALGGATSVGLAAICAGQAKAATAWCAWVDPERSLYAPGVVAAGVDLSRLLVVCPPRGRLGQVSVKVAASGAFEVVVVDMHPIFGAGSGRGRWTSKADSSKPGSKTTRAWPAEILVRKLALAAEASSASVLLLTDSTLPRATVWPTALRLELGRPNRLEQTLRVAKDRRGRIGLVKTLPFRPLVKASG